MKTCYLCVFLGAFSVGCGSATAAKAPEMPAEEKESTPSVEASKPEPAEAGPEPTRSASDTLLMAGQMYSLDFSSSEAGEKAEERCNSKHADNPKKRNQCKQNARAQIKDDVLHFVRDDSGNLFWITSEQRGNKLIRRKKESFTIQKETESEIELKVKGQARPVTIGLPNDYSIEVPSAKHGKLVYKAKADIATEQ